MLFKKKSTGLPYSNLKIPMPPVKPPKQEKLITFEKIEDLKGHIDAAIKLGLLFIIYNRNIETDETPIIVYCFELGEKI